jgi:hypothetical protein
MNKKDTTISPLVAKEILSLADEMAANASSFNCHTYDQFIESRKSLKELLHEISNSEKEKQ